MLDNAKWIMASVKTSDVCPVFRKEFSLEKEIKSANIKISALGVYVLLIQNQRVSDYVLAPGWTSYDSRVQFQMYDITSYLERNNCLEVILGKGWYASPMPGFVEKDDPYRLQRSKRQTAIIAEIRIVYKDGSEELIVSDDSWLWADSKVRFSEIYDGEVFDASYEIYDWKNAMIYDSYKGELIDQEGEYIRETEKVSAKRIIKTPKNETVIDFGQEVTGYVEFSLNAHEGDIVEFDHGEVLDKDGNFYNENYRSAKAVVRYVCKEGNQTYHPLLTFFGFRYIRLKQFPGMIDLEDFNAIVVHSDMKRTGYISSGNKYINQLFENIIWGQRGNFLDVPTDCPQRDERLGWTGDAQVFIKTASYNYDVEKFFIKWLHDLKCDQRKNGAVGWVIPDYVEGSTVSAAWGDAAVICPWQIYQTYGNISVLNDQFDSMKRWVDYISAATLTPYLWTGGAHFGDWLGLDAPTGSYKGSTREDFIASAFYAYSCSLLIKTGELIGKDMSKYKDLYGNIRKTFIEMYSDCKTQTECVLALQFDLANHKKEVVESLVRKIREADNQMQTGFVGTPYLLHVLSDNGHDRLAYDLLLREEFPSWLYSVKKGATTIWEHWDGIMENGDFWSPDMNSFNHYAYGSVADWLYEKAGGIQPKAGFEYIRFEPHTDPRFGWFEAKIESRKGTVSSKWTYSGDDIIYEIETPVEAEFVCGRKSIMLQPGKHSISRKKEEQ